MAQQNPVVLLTDVEAFIGPALIRMFVARGARVLAADPSFAEAGVASAYAAAHPGVTPVSQTTPAETVARALNHETAIDVLCTGGVHPANRTTAGDLSEDVTRPYFEKLVIEPLAYMSQLVEGMKARQYGRIVFVTSAGPVGGIPNFTAYASARAALNGSVRSLAIELGASGVSVNAVAPNYIETEAYFPQALISQPAVRSKILSRVPVRRFGEPGEAAAAVEFFALADARFVTGQVLSVSGGWS